MRTLGFLHRPRPAPALYGVVEAEAGLLRAIVRYSSWDRIVIWSDGHLDFPAGNDRVVVKAMSMMGDDIASGISALHHVGLGPSPLATMRGDIPIPIYTSVFAALSYNEQVPRHIAERLVRKTNLDTNIYPSTCSADAVARIDAWLAELNVADNGCLRRVVIPAGVDTSVWAPASASEKDQLRRSLSLPNDRLIAVVLSRFSPSDKADLLPLLKSIYAAGKSGAAVHYVFAGGSAYPGAKGYIKFIEAELEQFRLRDRVSIRVVGREQVIDLVRCADIFVSPADSVQETFGITPIEAMACGAPAVVSDWNGYRETVVHGETGFRVDTTFFDNSAVWNRLASSSDFRKQHLLIAQSVAVDTDAIVRHCSFLAESPEQLRRMSRAARTRAESLYSWAAVITEYEAIWRENMKPAFCTDQVGPTLLDHLAMFGTYATRFPDAAATYEVTQLGRSIAHGEVRLRILSELKDVISPALISQILDRGTQGGMTLAEMADFDAGSDAARFCVSWMLKQGLLRLAALE